MTNEYPPLQNLGSSVLLQGVALADAYYLVAAGLKESRSRQQKIPPRMFVLQDEIESALRSYNQQRRQSEVAKLPVPHNYSIGTDEAANILGRSRRHVQRIAKSLDGQRSGKSWTFDRRIVEAYGAANAA